MPETVTRPNLRIFRALDVEALTPEFVDKIEHDEGQVDYVDGDRPRDYPFTEEIMETTIGAALVDAEGNIIAEFDGPDAVARAERARSTAKITFSVDIESEAKPTRARRPAAVAEETTEAVEA